MKIKATLYSEGFYQQTREKTQKHFVFISSLVSLKSDDRATQIKTERSLY